MKKPKGKIILLVLVLAVAVFFTFLPTLRYGFVNWDDPSYLHDNPRIRELSWPAVAVLFTTLHVQIYKPLTELSFALEYHFFGLDPFVYHLDNLILHLLNCLLVFWLIYLLGGRVGVAFLAALFFGVHPLRVESVVWVTERKDVLYGFFFLGSLIAYLRYLASRRRKYYLLALIWFVLSLLTKAQGVALPGLLLLFDYFRGRRIAGRALWEKVPFFLVAVLFALINIFGQVAAANWDAGIFHRLLPNLICAAYGAVVYLVKLFLPVRLSAIYPFPDPADWGTFSLFTLAPAIVATLALGVVYSARHNRKIVFAALFFLINMAIVFQVVRIPTPSVVSDRYTYISALGIYYLASVLLWRLRRRYRRRPGRFLAAGAVVAALICFFFLARFRSAVWENSLTLWTDTLEKYPEVEAARHNLAWYYEEAGESEAAVAGYRETLRYDPQYYLAHFNLGGLLIDLGRPEEAELHLRRAVAIQPALAEAHNNLGLALFEQGRVEEAAAGFRRALELDPGYWQADYNLGRLEDGRGNRSAARIHLDRAAQLQPDHPGLRRELAEIFRRWGEGETANPDRE